MEPSGSQPTIKARVDERRKILGVKELSRNRNNRLPRDEVMND
jgi:hypothetical protein